MAVSPDQPQNGEDAAAVERRVARGPVVLFDRYQISPQEPLPSLDTPSAKAYAAEDRRDAVRNLFALICTPGLPPRSKTMTLLRGTATIGFMPLVEWGTVDWPHLGQRCMAVIYERPQGGTLEQALAPVEAGAGGDERIAERDIARRIIAPLIKALQRLAGRDAAHRAIRPDNIHFMDAERRNVVLGDCVTTPPGFDQPLILETVERAMASPGGRGEGDQSDDVYALGVSLAIAVIGHNPLAEISEEDLITAKVEHGTYAVLCGQQRISPYLIEVLRGMLADDRSERWDIEAVTTWLRGDGMAPVQHKAVSRAAVPFPFGGRDHVMGRTLARAFSQSAHEAASLIFDGQLELWVRRALKEPERADAIAAAIESVKAHTDDAMGTDDYLVCRICIILDPEGPIRFKGFSFLPEGFGPALAVELLRRGNVQVPAEIIALAIPSMWLASQDGFRGARAALERSFADLQAYLKNTDLGYGTERCLYELNPSLACQSPLIIQEYVATLEELLPALDDAAKRADSRSRPVDRHVAAFVAAHFKRDIDPLLRELSDPDEKRSSIGLLSLLAMV
jgi:hypothetical protein